MDEDVRWASAVAQRRLLDRGAISPTELRAGAVAAIERLDPLVHAVAAPLLERAVDGVPMVLKDAGQEIAGTPHWVGVAALRDAGATSTTTTDLARRFEAAGFSIVAKAACPQLSGGVTTEPPGFPPTRNPWDLDRSTGGSSGGSAAAVASGMVAVAHGSDATGSLRCPAALCGVATFAPTAGLVPGVPPAGRPASDVWRDFVLVRHAEDLTAVFRTLTGGDVAPLDRPLRVGLLDHDPELGLPVDTACAAAVRTAGDLLAALGHDVDLGWPPALDTFWSRAAGPVGVVGDAARPPMISWVAERLGRPVRSDELEEATFEAAGRAAGRAARDVAAAQLALQAAVEPLAAWWLDHDVLVTPATFRPAWPLGGTPGFAEIGSLLAPFSLSGQPCASVPIARTAGGLPVGAQLVGRRGDDAVVLRLVEELEPAVGWPAWRPPTG